MSRSIDPKMKLKRYLADGLYAGYDGFQLWLWTSDGFADTNAVALDDVTLNRWRDYLQDIQMFAKTDPATFPEQI